MTTLVLLRHAQAVPEGSGGDHERSLSDKGREDSCAIGQLLRASLPASVLILASDARRTRETAELAFAGWGDAAEIRTSARLYAASAATLRTYLREFSGPDALLVVVGHNPGIGDFARNMSGAGSAEDLARLRFGFPTAAAAIIACDGPWSGLRWNAGRLTATLVPDGVDWPE